MTIEFVSFEGFNTSVIRQLILDSKIINPSSNDDISPEEVYESLANGDAGQIVQIAINGECAGFFTVLPLGDYFGKDTVETHVYMFKSHRKYAIQVLREFSRVLLDVHERIVSSISDEIPWMLKILQRQGFKIIMNKPDIYRRDGISHGLTYIYKEV